MGILDSFVEGTRGKTKSTELWPTYSLVPRLVLLEEHLNFVQNQRGLNISQRWSSESP